MLSTSYDLDLYTTEDAFRSCSLSMPHATLRSVHHQCPCAPFYLSSCTPPSPPPLARIPPRTRAAKTLGVLSRPQQQPAKRCQRRRRRRPMLPYISLLDSRYSADGARCQVHGASAALPSSATIQQFVHVQFSCVDVHSRARVPRECFCVVCMPPDAEYAPPDGERTPQKYRVNRQLEVNTGTCNNVEKRCYNLII